MRPWHEVSAVVTGANRERGIGLAIVRELLARGAPHVVATYRERSRSEPLLRLAEADPRVITLRLDVADDASAEAFGRACREALPGLDLLVNNAGITSTSGPATTAPVADLQRQIETHAVGMLRVTQALHPLLGPGSVVLNVSSSLGSLERMGRAYTFYGPAKALQNALTRQLRRRCSRTASCASRCAPAGSRPTWRGATHPGNPRRPRATCSRWRKRPGRATRARTATTTARTSPGSPANGRRPAIRRASMCVTRGRLAYLSSQPQRAKLPLSR